MPKFVELGFKGVIEIQPDCFQDERGFFSEVWNADQWRAGGIDVSFVQDNHSRSAKAGTLRGLHFQVPPAGQAKLVRVISGSVFDVVVDVRRGSPTFGQWIGVEISAAKWNQLFIPEGFAHGFVTLEDNTDFLYKVTNLYTRAHDRVIRFDDPAIGIKWPVDVSTATISVRDLSAPSLADCNNGFTY